MGWHYTRGAANVICSPVHPGCLRSGRLLQRGAALSFHARKKLTTERGVVSMKSSYNGNPIPAEGKAIGYSGGEVQVPDTPIIPFIEGDGTGRAIWKASRRGFDSSVGQAYGGEQTV